MWVCIWHVGAYCEEQKLTCQVSFAKREEDHGWIRLQYISAGKFITYPERYPERHINNFSELFLLVVLKISLRSDGLDCAVLAASWSVSAIDRRRAAVHNWI